MQKKTFDFGIDNVSIGYVRVCFGIDNELKYAILSLSEVRLCDNLLKDWCLSEICPDIK